MTKLDNHILSLDSFLCMVPEMYTLIHIWHRGKSQAEAMADEVVIWAGEVATRKWAEPRVFGIIIRPRIGAILGMYI